MKKIIICLALLPFMVFAQNQSSMEDAMKKLEEAKKSMNPEQKKMMEQMGIEQTMKNTQKNMKPGNATSGMKMADDPNKIPGTISMLVIPATPASKVQLVAYLKSMFAQTEKVMRPENVKAVQNLLNKGWQTGQIAMVFWTNDELDKALYLLENACISTPDDYLSLNNLSALLILSGYAHKALPLLLYAQKFVPESSTLLNNIGQAYLSLGYIDKAKKNLLLSVGKDTANAEAQRSMALIARQQGDNAACAGYAQKAIQNGGITAELVNLLQQVSPQTNMVDLIRPRYKKYYKDHSITKRFVTVAIPASYNETVSRYVEIETYLKNLDATINASGKTGREMMDTYNKNLMQTNQQRMADLQKITAMAGQPGSAEARRNFVSEYTHPLMLQSTVMLANMDNPQFSTSWNSRLKREDEKKTEQENKLQQSLANDYDKKITALKNQSGKIEGGEGDVAGNNKLADIESQVCELQTERLEKWYSERAKIYSQYIHNIEDLLSQRLQEQTFWTTIQSYPTDATGRNYAFYQSYLRDLYHYASPLYPTNIDGGLPTPCKANPEKFANISGKIQLWELEHCDVDFGIDLFVTGGKFNCQGWSVYGDFKAGSFKYERSVDPVTWETTGHSISAKAGKDKEFEITKNLKGSIGASVETTIKFDGNMTPVDLIVKGEVGAEIKTKPLIDNGVSETGEPNEESSIRGKAGITLAEVEISVRSGFNAAGPSIPSFGSSFLK